MVVHRKKFKKRQTVHNKKVIYTQEPFQRAGGY